MIHLKYCPQNFAEPDQAKMEANSELYSGLMASLGLVVGTANLLMNYYLAKAGDNLTMRLRQLTFSAMLRQEIGWYDDKKNQVGALTSRLATEASLVRQVCSRMKLIKIQSQHRISIQYLEYNASWTKSYLCRAIPRACNLLRTKQQFFCEEKHNMSEMSKLQFTLI